MTMRFDHSSVPATDKVGEARGGGDFFGVTVTPGHVAPGPVNESLTLDCADGPEPLGGPGFAPRTGQRHHDAFQVSEVECATIVGRSQARGSPTAAGHPPTLTASSPPAGVGGASTARTPTATCRT